MTTTQKEQTIHLRISPDHKDTIREAAEIKGMSLASFIRTTMLDRARDILSAKARAEDA